MYCHQREFLNENDAHLVPLTVERTVRKLGETYSVLRTTSFYGDHVLFTALLVPSSNCSRGEGSGSSIKPYLIIFIMTRFQAELETKWHLVLSLKLHAVNARLYFRSPAGSLLHLPIRPTSSIFTLSRHVLMNSLLDICRVTLIRFWGSDGVEGMFRGSGMNSFSNHLVVIEIYSMEQISW